MLANKEIELHLFNEFRRLSRVLTLTHIEQPDPPAPDILADFGHTRVGVEIIRHLGQTEKHRESEEELITELARRQYETSGKPAVGVTIHWVRHERRDRSARLSMSRALASVVLQNTPQLGTCCDVDCESLPEPLATSVHHMRIDRLINYTTSDWRVLRGGWFPDVQPDHIRMAIATKESRFETYRRYCDELWLLIASEGFGPSSWCELSEASRRECYTTHFNCVFFLASHPREVIKLRCKDHQA